MKLKLYTIGGRYSFALDDFSSHEHFFLTSNVKSSYKYAWQAYSDARNLAMSTPVHVEAIKKQVHGATQDLTKDETMDISAEEMIHQHYDSIYQIIEERSEGQPKEDDKEIIYGEIKAIVEEILNIQEKVEDEKTKASLQEVIVKFRRLVKEKYANLLKKDAEENKKMEDIAATPPPAPEEQYDPALPTSPVSKAASSESFVKMASNIPFNILESYAISICKAIEKKHPSAIYRIAKDNSIMIVDVKSGSGLLKIEANDELSVNGIYPLGEISDIYPSHSKEFYQRYWKPVVECVGHYALTESNLIYGKLPDIPIENKEFKVKSSGNNVMLRFGTNIWELQAKPMDAASEQEIPKKVSEYTEADFKEDTIVECIVPELKSIFGKKGVIVQVIPLQSHIELDVKFLEKDRGVKRLTTDQIKIVNV